MKVTSGDVGSDKLRTLLKLAARNISAIAKLKCDEFLNLIILKCPWLSPQSAHHKCLGALSELCLKLFHVAPGYISPTLKHLLSLFCIS